MQYHSFRFIATHIFVLCVSHMQVFLLHLYDSKKLVLKSIWSCPKSVDLLSNLWL